ncbi:hypothetical protein BDY17DRAFT_292979 [Neohortaea acidophila]|uniref:Uncharacterized protein n=1 Tax=Neohortaea acidophila TaxID=245834 RepID=A0A6A6PYP6_9PEZI|nr:uncharacterized protein BDY17DRAFT_292979 [Neohortaea acidophila]KAF2485125.1 hypothetical protein BDY17DRAFT_292979 [Neohortaea acidophila]
MSGAQSHYAECSALYHQLRDLVINVDQFIENMSAQSDDGMDEEQMGIPDSPARMPDKYREVRAWVMGLPEVKRALAIGSATADEAYKMTVEMEADRMRLDWEGSEVTEDGPDPVHDNVDPASEYGQALARASRAAERGQLQRPAPTIDPARALDAYVDPEPLRAWDGDDEYDGIPWAQHIQPFAAGEQDNPQVDEMRSSDRLLNSMRRRWNISE